MYETQRKGHVVQWSEASASRLHALEERRVRKRTHEHKYGYLRINILSQKFDSKKEEEKIC